MNPPPSLSGLYAIADSSVVPDEEMEYRVGEAIAGGARLIQYRDKIERPSRRGVALRLLTLCRSHNIPLIINDDLELAAQIGADGVHLGRDDPSISAARQRLGPTAIIGVSCYNRLSLAQQAEASGADYLAFGRFFPSLTKAQAVQADPALLGKAKQTVRLPVVAIGGITPENGASLICAGADMLAVIHALFGPPDTRAVATAFSKLFRAEDNH